MIKYTPFLKLKQNEVQGVAVLAQNIRDQIVPLYDIPRSDETMSEADVSNRLRIADNALQSSLKIAPKYSFILDNFDLDDSIDIAGVPQYRAILSKFSALPVIPTLAFDRHTDHNKAALDYVSGSGCDVVIRLQEVDIDSYKLTKLKLNSIWPAVQVARPKTIILVLDLRIISDVSASKLKIERFLNSFYKDFNVAVTTIVGSIIPANIAQLIGTADAKHVSREECVLWRSLQSQPAFKALIFGDYCVVSPEYSDIDLAPELLSGVSTPKVFYAYLNNFYIERGRRFKSHGYGQYFTMSEAIVKESFYRGASYSFGDQYIHDRSHLSAKKPAKGGSPGSWIKSLTSAHITFIVNTI